MIKNSLRVSGNVLCRLSKHIFNYKTVSFVNCHSYKLYNSDIIFPNTEVISVIDSQSIFISEWLKPSIFPTLKQINFDSKLDDYTILNRFYHHNIPIYLNNKYRYIKEYEEKVIPLDHVIMSLDIHDKYNNYIKEDEEWDVIDVIEGENILYNYRDEEYIINNNNYNGINLNNYI